MTGQSKGGEIMQKKDNSGMKNPNDLTSNEFLQAHAINKMLVQHLNEHIEQGLELAVYVFKWPVEYIQIKEYKNRPFRQLILDSPGSFEILLEIELKPNPINPMTIDTYISGAIAEFMTYNMIKGGKTR